MQTSADTLIQNSSHGLTPNPLHSIPSLHPVFVERQRNYDKDSCQQRKYFLPNRNKDHVSHTTMTDLINKTSVSIKIE
jgi:hypothetical protein